MSSALFLSRQWLVLKDWVKCSDLQRVEMPGQAALAVPLRQAGCAHSRPLSHGHLNARLNSQIRTR